MTVLITTLHTGLAFGLSRGGRSNGKVRCACAQAHGQQAASLALPVTWPPISEPGEMKEDSLKKRRPMPKMRLGAEQIITNLRQVGFLRGQGKSVVAACKEAGLGEAKVIIEQGRFDNTTRRRHSALGYCPPAPVTIVPRPHSTEPQTCNSFSRRLAENVGQATGIMPQRSGLVYPVHGSRVSVAIEYISSVAWGEFRWLNRIITRVRSFKPCACA